jgi:pimeloyl-ACP methyl ester carboxylesterase
MMIILSILDAVGKGFGPIPLAAGDVAMTAPRYPLAAPPMRLRALENLAVVEMCTAVPTLPLLALAPRGDGHPVLVLPGFTSSDSATWYLRTVLRAKGYAAHGWGLGTNVGPHPRIVRGIQRRLEQIADRDGRSVSVVGWSLGGTYARELARAHPELVRGVITLGSPFRLRGEDRSTAHTLYRRLAPRDDPYPGRRSHEHHRGPVPVPTTSIYTRTDGVARWHACIDEVGPTSENIEVRGTHSGLGFNSAALLAVTDRLAQPEGAWQPFRRPPVVAHLFPRPATWQPRWLNETA